VHDVTPAETLLADVESEVLIGDKAYDADGFIPALTIRRIERVTPPKTNRKGRRDATSPSTPNAIFSSVSSMLSNNSEAFQLVTKRSLETSLPASTSLAPCLA
jgi:hypothetical protein